MVVHKSLRSPANNIGIYNSILRVPENMFALDGRIGGFLFLTFYWVQPMQIEVWKTKQEFWTKFL